MNSKHLCFYKELYKKWPSPYLDPLLYLSTYITIEAILLSKINHLSISDLEVSNNMCGIIIYNFHDTLKKKFTN